MKIVQDDHNITIAHCSSYIMELNLHLLCFISGYILMALDKINCKVQIHS